MTFGDYHNFQRRVEINDTSVLKPRSVWPEWLFLGENSPLRNHLKNAGFEFDQIVRLIFYSKIEKEPALELNKVQKIKLQNSINYSPEDFFKVGTTLGFCTFFGLGDLHYENMVSGELDGRFIFSPIDIECLFENFTLPSQTLLIPSYVLKLEHCGMRNFIEKIQNEDAFDLISPLLDGYVSSLKTLYSLKDKIYNLLEQLGVEHAYTRVIIRSTFRYKEDSALLYEEEKEQLKRGDIPYFFKFLNRDEIYYWVNEHEYCQINSKIEDSKLERQLKRFSYSFFSIYKEETQIIYGVAQIAKLFIPQLRKKRELLGRFFSLNEYNGKIRISVIGKKITC